MKGGEVIPELKITTNIIPAPPPAHRCDPPERLPDDHWRSYPVGTLWRCDCNRWWLRKDGEWGESWRKVRIWDRNARRRIRDHI